MAYAPVGMHRVAVPPASAEELGVGIAQLCNRVTPNSVTAMALSASWRSRGTVSSDTTVLW
jgi:hypothetical protein